jgi:hypothetical protein
MGNEVSWPLIAAGRLHPAGDSAQQLAAGAAASAGGDHNLEGESQVLTRAQCPM